MFDFLRKLFCPAFNDADELRERVASLNQQLTDVKERLRIEESMHSTTNQNLADALHDVARLRAVLDEQDAEYDVKKPVFISEKPPYLPAIAVPDSKDSVQVFDATAIYLPTDRDKKETAALKALPKAERLKAIWQSIITPASLVYVADDRDHWQTPYSTRFRRKGDCEDGTVWFIAKCRAAGISPLEVFNAVGPSKFGYHSYPIVWLSSEDADVLGAKGEGDGWYIFESTLDALPSKPLKLDGAPYWIDNGLANWLFAGQILPAFMDEFNGKAPASLPGDQYIDNSVDKIRKIRKYHAELV